MTFLAEKTRVDICHDAVIILVFRGNSFSWNMWILLVAMSNHHLSS